MKTEDLIALGVSQEVADQIFALHGKELTKVQTAADSLKAEGASLKTQLADANKQIEDFKGMNVDEIRKNADDYKAKFEQAQTDAAAQLANLKFDHALESALIGAKAKNAKAVTSLLSKDALKLNEDGSILGLKEQLESIKSENDYLFISDAPPTPRIVTGGNNQSVLGDKVVDAARKAAGLTTEKT